MSSPWQPGQLLFTGFEGETIPSDLAALIRQGRIGGVVLFARNLRDPHQVPRLCRELLELAPAAAPLLLAIDQEGGRVQRLKQPWTEWPPARCLGTIDDHELTGRVARAIAKELGDLGIGLDFAPVLDIDTNSSNPVIGDRSFAPTAAKVIRHGAAFVTAMQQAGVACCGKHFPGHGDTDLDSHLALPVVRHDLHRLRELELQPFAAGIAAGIASIMTAHIVVESLDRRRPATLSREVLAILRQDLGYDGVVFSDDLEMQAIAQHWQPREFVPEALQAGIDGLLVCSQTGLRDEVLYRLEHSKDAALESALQRMLELKQKYARAPAAETDPLAGYPQHREIAREIADRLRV